jgi:hypothetical protein
VTVTKSVRSISTYIKYSDLYLVFNFCGSHVYLVIERQTGFSPKNPTSDDVPVSMHLILWLYLGCTGACVLLAAKRILLSLSWLKSGRSLTRTCVMAMTMLKRVLLHSNYDDRFSMNFGPAKNKKLHLLMAKQLRRILIR